MATLGVVAGNEIEVSASGRQGREAVDAIRALAERGFDEGMEPAEVEEGPHRTSGTLEEVLGLPASPGIAVGEIRRFHVPAIEVPERQASDAAEEDRRLDAAIATARNDIEHQRVSVARRAGPYQAAIFEAHLLFLDDQELIAPARRAIATGATARRHGEMRSRTWRGHGNGSTTSTSAPVPPISKRRRAGAGSAPGHRSAETEAGGRRRGRGP